MTHQPYAVLCTQGGGQPYGSIVAFVPNSEFNAVVFPTPIDSHKYRLLTDCDQVSLVVDNRTDFPADELPHLEAVTAIGQAIQLSEKQEEEVWKQRLLNKHPQMHEFLFQHDIVLFRIDIKTYIHVARLKEVSRWIPPSSPASP